MLKFNLLVTLFALACTAAFAQVASERSSEDDLPLIQQKATITTFGEKGVLLEVFSKDEPLRKVKLAGPRVGIYTSPGKVFQIDDLNSASVGGTLGEDDITFYGDLTLTSLEWGEDTPTSDHIRVTAYDALVEIRTIRVSPADSVNRVFRQNLQQTVPLNQQGDFIRSMKERAKRIRDS